jgi:hypothetical protein
LRTWQAIARLFRQALLAGEPAKAFPAFIGATRLEQPMHRRPEKERLLPRIARDESPSGESLLLHLGDPDNATNDEALDALAKCLFGAEDDVSE